MMVGSRVKIEEYLCKLLTLELNLGAIGSDETPAISITASSARCWAVTLVPTFLVGSPPQKRFAGRAYRDSNRKTVTESCPP